MKKFSHILVATSISATVLITGCAGGGNYNYGNPAIGAVSQATLGAMQQGIIGNVGNSLLQGLASSVINGQLGSQIHPNDQNFRLQQLAGLTQSGTIDQTQQWSNPQTGNTLQITPVGQQTVDPYTNQNCRTLEETYTTVDGRQIKETRRACQDQTGKWVLVQ